MLVPAVKILAIVLVGLAIIATTCYVMYYMIRKVVDSTKQVIISTDHQQSLTTEMQQLTTSKLETEMHQSTTPKLEPFLPVTPKMKLLATFPVIRRYRSTTFSPFTAIESGGSSDSFDSNFATLPTTNKKMSTSWTDYETPQHPYAVPDVTTKRITQSDGSTTHHQPTLSDARTQNHPPTTATYQTPQHPYAVPDVMSTTPQPTTSTNNSAPDYLTPIAVTSQPSISTAAVTLPTMQPSTSTAHSPSTIPAITVSKPRQTVTLPTRTRKPSFIDKIKEKIATTPKPTTNENYDYVNGVDPYERPAGDEELTTRL